MYVFINFVKSLSSERYLLSNSSSNTSCFNNYPGNEITVEYKESVYVGYKYYDKVGKDVLFPFGFGLSYTTFDITEPKAAVEGDNLVVSVKVKNTGAVDGDEVVQLYVGFENSAVDRPVKQLRGFKRVSVKAGEEVDVTITTPLEKLKWYNPVYRTWELEKMAYPIYVGSSAADEDLVKTEITIA